MSSLSKKLRAIGCRKDMPRELTKAADRIEELEDALQAQQRTTAKIVEAREVEQNSIEERESIINSLTCYAKEWCGTEMFNYKPMLCPACQAQADLKEKSE